jgi:hypothetical protein
LSTGVTSHHDMSPIMAAPQEAPRDAARPIGDIWQWLGMSGDVLGPGGALRQTFLYSFGAVAAMVAVVNAINVITVTHEMPRAGLVPPIIWEGSSWITLLAFFWIPWLGYRLAPPFVRPRWKLLVHLPMALAFSLCHVGGFILLRKLAYLAMGAHYDFGPFLSGLLYEFRKDALGYALFMGGFALIERLLRQQQLIETPKQTLTFDIRDGAKLHRVRLEDVLAIASAGNYVEFVLTDGRRLLMRSPLSALEEELADRGFLRTHRSWLVNSARLTALRPQGSGDYVVVLDTLDVPLSRRFPDALARLRGS